MQLTFSSIGQSWFIQLNERTPRSCQALLSQLPLSTQLHTPKIAGSHIYWHAPFIEDVEGATDVLDTKAGAFIYWPVRQFLEITFAPLQAEKAQVTILGHVEGNIEGIAALAERVKYAQGHHIITATLELTKGAETLSIPPPIILPDDIVVRREAIWQKMPEEIAHLLASRAIMHPAGPVLTAESQMRNLHEFLWWLRCCRQSVDEQHLRQNAALALNKAATILHDFCHLQETPDMLFRLEQLMAEKLPFKTILDEAILVSGRLSAWMDLLIPWNDINEAFRKAS